MLQHATAAVDAVDDPATDTTPTTDARPSGRADTARPFKDLKRELIDEFERQYLLRLLSEPHSLSSAMRSSGLSRRHLRTLLRKHGHYQRFLRERIAKLMEELS